MIKSFQTSGGTVLSTDWGDVSKKDYEGKDRPDAPAGQEWRKAEIWFIVNIRIIGPFNVIIEMNSMIYSAKGTPSHGRIFVNK